jgi:cell division septation protein DedD
VQLPVESDGEFAIQVAMCFLPACVSEFQEKLNQQNLAMQVEETSATQETVEVYSETAFATQDEAAALADSINREFRMRDQVYVFSDDNEFHISMGSFADLARAESFQDVLNQRFQGRATFAPRIRSSDYRMQLIVAGSFTSRQLAEAALARLVAADTAFAESYVVRR